MTDLAQVAIAIGVENGVLEYDEINIDKYEEDVLGMSKEEIAANSHGRSPDVKVSFVKLVNDDVLKTGEVVDFFFKLCLSFTQRHILFHKSNTSLYIIIFR